MFSFYLDPGVSTAGVAFCDAVGPDGGRLDLSLTWPGAWRSPDWDVLEAELGLPVFNSYQVHGNRVLRVDSDTNPAELAQERADALVSTGRGLGLAVRAADCLPVLFADPAAQIVAAAHAGRVGLGAGVLDQTVESMVSLGAASITAWIGPHICGECYEVPEEMREEYGRLNPSATATTSWGTPSLDLGAAAEARLSAAGCLVVRVDPCTRTNPHLHSHRRDGAAAGRQAGIVWLG